VRSGKQVMYSQAFFPSPVAISAILPECSTHHQLIAHRNEPYSIQHRHLLLSRYLKKCFISLYGDMVFFYSKVLSSSVAVLSRVVLSLNLRAVSLIAANASVKFPAELLLFVCPVFFQDINFLVNNIFFIDVGYRQSFSIFFFGIDLLINCTKVLLMRSLNSASLPSTGHCSTIDTL
jgi:hypothetical protein